MRLFRDFLHIFPINNTAFSVLRLADAALSAARRAKKGKTSEATDAFLRVQEELTLFDLPAPSEDVLCDQRTMRLSPSTMLESTSEGEISAGARAVPKAKPTLNLKASVSHLFQL